MATSTALLRISVPPKVIGTHTAATAVSTAHPAAAAQQSDLFQVIGQGGKIVWNMNYLGVVAVNPANPTKDALLGKFFGTNFSSAFTNLSKLDFLQIHDGSSVVYRVDSSGTAHTP